MLQRFINRYHRRLPDWSCKSVAVLGTGPSLTCEQVEKCRSAGCRLFAIKSAYQLAPDADSILAHPSFLERLPLFPGLKYALPTEWPRPGAGTLAIALALEAGPAKIILLGFDGVRDAAGRVHWNGPPDHPVKFVSKRAKQKFGNRCDYFADDADHASLAVVARERGVEIWNVSPISELPAFPRVAIDEVT